MIGTTGSRPPMARRQRLSRVRRIGATPRSAIRRGNTRAGFHGLVTAIGLVAAVTVWNAPRGAIEPPLRAGEAVELAAGEGQGDQIAPLAFVEAAPVDAGQAQAQAAAGQASGPVVRTVKVVEGDTLRSIAAEYSVSISTILASNKLDDPNMISPGQEILIPPIEGVVAEVKPDETLAQLAERFGVEAGDIAQANALPNDADMRVPYERIVIPGMETAERTLAGGPRRQDGVARLNAREDADGALAAKPSGLTYEVQEGDTVAQLATQFGVSVWTILTANNLGDADLIRPGMRLKVLPVNGIEHEIQPGESLSDIAAFYKVDLGPLVDFNAISDPDNLQVGMKLTIPGAERAQPGFSLAQAGAPATTAQAAPAAAGTAASVAAAQRPAAQAALAQAKPSGATAQAAAKPAGATAQAAAKPAASTAQAAAKPAGSTNRLQAAAVSAPVTIASGASGGSVVGTAMKFLGARYVFGGTSPAGFDCSGFVWYVHNAVGKPVSRGLWGQMNGGPRIPTSQLQPGDTVFFANTYMPGLSHAGIYIGGGRFIHASDESSGVKISSLSDGYWGPRYIGATRLN
jgi:cell wall-associated NlpC family hydrolase